MAGLALSVASPGYATAQPSENQCFAQSIQERHKLADRYEKAARELHDGALALEADAREHDINRLFLLASNTLVQALNIADGLCAAAQVAQGGVQNPICTAKDIGQDIGNFAQSYAKGDWKKSLDASVSLVSKSSSGLGAVGKVLNSTSKKAEGIEAGVNGEQVQGAANLASGVASLGEVIPDSAATAKLKSRLGVVDGLAKGASAIDNFSDQDEEYKQAVRDSENSKRHILNAIENARTRAARLEALADEVRPKDYLEDPFNLSADDQNQCLGEEPEEPKKSFDLANLRQKLAENSNELSRQQDVQGRRMLASVNSGELRASTQATKERARVQRQQAAISTGFTIGLTGLNLAQNLTADNSGYSNTSGYSDACQQEYTSAQRQLIAAENSGSDICGQARAVTNVGRRVQGQLSSCPQSVRNNVRQYVAQWSSRAAAACDVGFK